jgi:2-polyprenyl-3-methyl-5-hydroxy-6-metoxy-1,4-benzoquinol methylase
MRRASNLAANLAVPIRSGRPKGTQPAAEPIVLSGTGPSAYVEPLPDGKHRISIEGGADLTGPCLTWVTSYPLSLIREMYATKGMYVCDEIMREEDPRYVERSIRHEVLGYVKASDFAGKRVLDFGCGAGASTSVLWRLLPPCEIVGVDLQDRLLSLARARALHFGMHGACFLRSPSPDSIPADMGAFDFVILSAVYEHLLPTERRTLLPRLWSHVKPGGVLFLNQTPHRYSPVELHTTGLPLINFLPDCLAMRAARRFSRHVDPAANWERMLRDGIRGGTVREITRMLRGSAAVLAPRAEVGDRIDLWYGKLSRRHALLKKTIWASLKALKMLSGTQLTPELALALRKQAPSFKSIHDDDGLRVGAGTRPHEDGPVHSATNFFLPFP